MNIFSKKLSRRVFLDYASTTPTDKRVVKAMAPFWSLKFANPQALYQESLETKKAIESARKKIASIVAVKPNEIVFTGSGTESDNLAIIGTVNQILEEQDKKEFVPHFVTTNIEHPAVMETFLHLEKNGYEVTYLKVGKDGRINPEQVKNALKENTVLVSVIMANNEIGTIMPIREIGDVIHKYKKEVGKTRDQFPYFHTDASQAPNFLDVSLNGLNVDLLTLDGSKIYGPKGIGCLIKKNYVPCQAIQFGGGQENYLRPGTENVPLIIGFATALEITIKMRKGEFKRMKKLQEYLYENLEKEFPKVTLNGSKKFRLPNNVNICLPGINSEFAVIQLDELGISCSAMTACKNISEEARSYVVDALGDDSQKKCGTSSLRFTMGRETTKKDLDFLIKNLRKIF